MTTKKIEFENKYYKVAERGCSYVVAVLFNPITFKEETINIYDNDYENPITNEEYYYLPINEKVKEMYLHFKGVIKIGDLVKVVKGRKMLNETKRVTKIFDYKIHNGLSITYLVFDDNTKVQQDNCILIHEFEKFL